MAPDGSDDGGSDPAPATAAPAADATVPSGDPPGPGGDERAADDEPETRPGADQQVTMEDYL